MRSLIFSVLILASSLVMPGCGNKSSSSSSPQNKAEPPAPVPQQVQESRITEENLAQLCHEGIPTELTAWWINSPAVQIFQAIQSKSSKKTNLGKCTRSNSLKNHPFVNAGSFCGFEYSLDVKTDIKVTLNFPQSISFEINDTKFGEVVTFIKGTQPGLAWVNPDGSQKQPEAYLITAACLKNDQTGGFFALLGEGRVLELNP
jgi:hypothetical protein